MLAEMFMSPMAREVLRRPTAFPAGLVPIPSDGFPKGAAAGAETFFFTDSNLAPTDCCAGFRFVEPHLVLGIISSNLELWPWEIPALVQHRI